MMVFGFITLYIIKYGIRLIKNSQIREIIPVADSLIDQALKLLNEGFNKSKIIENTLKNK